MCRTLLMRIYVIHCDHDQKSPFFPIIAHVKASFILKKKRKKNTHIFFLVVIFWKRPDENLFCSSSSVPQFPGRNGHTGSNVQQISVSVPLFPCVNALTSKNTTSLCIYCVDGGCRLLSISPLLGFSVWRSVVGENEPL